MINYCCYNIFFLQPFTKQALVFMCLQYKSFENTVIKGDIARNEQFLLFSQSFLHVWRTLPSSSNLKLSSANSFSLEESKICHFWKGLNLHLNLSFRLQITTVIFLHCIVTIIFLRLRDIQAYVK